MAIMSSIQFFLLILTQTFQMKKLIIFIKILVQQKTLMDSSTIFIRKKENLLDLKQFHLLTAPILRAIDTRELKNKVIFMAI